MLTTGAILLLNIGFFFPSVRDPKAGPAIHLEMRRFAHAVGAVGMESKGPEGIINWWDKKYLKCPWEEILIQPPDYCLAPFVQIQPSVIWRV